MRRVGVVFLGCLLTGCTGGLAERQVELSHWVGQPESQLVAAMGAPNRVFESGATKFLTYEDVSIDRGPIGLYDFGLGPAAEFSGPLYTTVCDTTFTVADGRVKAISLRGGGCG